MNIFTLLLGGIIFGLLAISLVSGIVFLILRKWKWLKWTAIAAVSSISAIIGSVALVTYILDDSVRREISKIEVVGTWSMTSDSLNQVRIDTHHDYDPQSITTHSIKFEDNGTCMFRSILENAPQYAPTYISSTGKWSIRNNEIEISLDSPSMSFKLYFAERKNHLIIWDYWSDPDEGKRLEYQKAS